MAKERGNVKILSKVVDEIFKSHPEVAEDAQTMKSARNYLTDLVLKELNDKSKVDLDVVFSTVKEKLEKMVKKKGKIYV